MGDDLVTPAIQVEPIDIVPTQQGGERRANVLHGDAKTIGLVMINLEVDLRCLKRKVQIGEDEHAALVRGLAQLVHDI